MTWMGLAALMLLGALGAKKLISLLKPLPDDGKRQCPHCGHSFEGERRYCLACGGQIWDDVLSEEQKP